MGTQQVIILVFKEGTQASFFSLCNMPSVSGAMMSVY